MPAKLLDSPRLDLTDVRARALMDELKRAYPRRREALGPLRAVMHEWDIDLDGPATEFWPEMFRSAIRLRVLRELVDHSEHDESVRGHWPSIRAAREDLEMTEGTDRDADQNGELITANDDNGDAGLARVIQLRSRFDEAIVLALRELRRRVQGGSRGSELGMIIQLERVLPDLLRELDLIADSDGRTWRLTPVAINCAANARDTCLELQHRLDERADSLIGGTSRTTRALSSIDSLGVLRNLRAALATTLETLLAEMPQSRSRSAL